MRKAEKQEEERIAMLQREMAECTFKPEITSTSSSKAIDFSGWPPRSSTQAN